MEQRFAPRVLFVDNLRIVGERPTLSDENDMNKDAPLRAKSSESITGLVSDQAMQTIGRQMRRRQSDAGTGLKILSICGKRAGSEQMQVIVSLGGIACQ